MHITSSIHQDGTWLFVLSECAVVLSYLSDCATAEFNFLYKNQSQRQASGTALMSPGSQNP